MKTVVVYNNKEDEEQMESLMFTCINMTQRDEAFVLIDIKLPNRNGIHKLRMKIDTGAQGKLYQFLHSAECSQKNWMQMISQT